MTSWRTHAVLALAVLGACANATTGTGGAPEGPPPPAQGAGAGADDAAQPRGDAANAGDAADGDPFAAQPEESEGLTNVSADLDAILEHGALAAACDRYEAGQTDRKTVLACGKWMFFYDPLGTAGVPAALVKFLAANFPDDLGLGFEKLGMVPDPTSADHLPLGIAPTTPMSGGVDAVAFTCASCHFARLSDGRYAVGAPNHKYDYGGHILTIMLAPTIGLGTSSAADHDPAAVARVKPVLDRLAADAVLKARFGLAMLPLASIQQAAISKEVEAEYASWPLGTLDFVIPPLPIDDGVHIVGKMIGLWGIPRAAESSAAGMVDALLGWAGDARSLDEFLGGFAALGGAGAPDAKKILPLAEFVYSLRAPANPAPPDGALAATGAAIFRKSGCIGCHDGPRGSGKRAYAFADVGTDDALAKWLDPTLSGTACCGITIAPGALTHGVKSPRLVGMWALERFLHDGALSSLEEVLCVEPRPAGATALGTGGHTFGCELGADEKKALLAYLRAH